MAASGDVVGESHVHSHAVVHLSSGRGLMVDDDSDGEVDPDDVASD